MIDEEIEAYRDKKWRREDSLRVKQVVDVEAFVNEVGFCLGLTDVKKQMPSVYVAVCGRRDASMPRNVQKDPESSAAWVLKDEVIERGKIYYGKIYKGNSMFIAPRLIPILNTLWGCSRKGESGILSKNAQKVLKVLRNEWEMATSDLREECKFKDKKELTAALDELQKRMKVVPQLVIYKPKFTYIWTLAEGRFPNELKKKISREKAVLELAKIYLTAFGMTLRGELAGKFGLSRTEAGKANHELVDKGFAERVSTGVYRLSKLEF